MIKKKLGIALTMLACLNVNAQKIPYKILQINDLAPDVIISNISNYVTTNNYGDVHQGHLGCRGLIDFFPQLLKTRRVFIS